MRCVCVMEKLLPQFQARLICTWCSVHLQMNNCTYKNSFGMLYQTSSKHFGSLILCFLVSVSSAAASVDRLLLGLNELRERSP